MPIMRHITLTCKLTFLTWHYKHAPLKGISDHKGLKFDVAYFVYYLHHFGSHIVWNKQYNKINAQFMDMVTKCTSNKNDKDAKGPRIRDNHVNKRWKSWEPFHPNIFFRKHTWTPPPPRGMCWNQFCELRWGWISHETINSIFYHIPPNTSTTKGIYFKVFLFRVTLDTTLASMALISTMLSSIKPKVQV